MRLAIILWWGECCLALDNARIIPYHQCLKAVCELLSGWNSKTRCESFMWRRPARVIRPGHAAVMVRHAGILCSG